MRRGVGVAGTLIGRGQLQPPSRPARNRRAQGMAHRCPRGSRPAPAVLQSPLRLGRVVGGTCHSQPMQVLVVAAVVLSAPWWPPTATADTCQVHLGVPDSVCTPGDRYGRVTQETIAITICAKGWSKSVRPPKTVTDQIKGERMAAYGVTGPPGTYELDHLIPIELGGASTVANLWPQPWDGPVGAHVKDRLEDWLHSLVCFGRLPLDVAQHEIAADWVSAYHENFG